MKRLIGLFLIVALSFTIVQAQDSIYYVSTTGSDTAAGTLAAPWRTIQKAANVAPANSTVIVATGTYAEFVSIIRSSIAFQAQGATVKGFYITGSNVTVSGFAINDSPSYGVELRGSNSTIKNNIITRGKSSGIWVSGVNNLIENNDVSKVIQLKPDASGGDANCITFFGSGHVFRGNYCHDIYSDGVLVTDAHIDGFQTWNWLSVGGVGHDVLFEDNYMSFPINGKIWNMEQGAYNITIKNNVTISGLVLLIIDGKNIAFLNNTFIGTGSVSDGFHLQRTTATIYNNIFAHQQQRVIDNLSSTITASNNCYIDYGITLAANAGDVRSTNAYFVNEAAGDYHLLSNSPCIDKGLIVSVVDDKDGVIRPQGAGYDMGAFEYMSVIINTPTPTRTAIPPTQTTVPPTAIIPTATSAMECILFPVHNVTVCLP
jgi:parallel beta-helix repeat protein